MSTIRCVLRGCTQVHKTLASVEPCDEQAFEVFKKEDEEELRRELAAIPKYDPAIHYCFYPPCGKLLPPLLPGKREKFYCGHMCRMSHYQWRLRREGAYVPAQAGEPGREWRRA